MRPTPSPRRNRVTSHNVHAIDAMPCGTTIPADLGRTTLAQGVSVDLVVGVTAPFRRRPDDAVFVIRATATLTLTAR